ncbi:MAG: GNAT family N-acetyltransferase [Granulosicoccus sp.]
MLPVDVTVSLASISQKDVLANLMQLYLYDTSEYVDANVNSCGVFETSELEPYRVVSNRYPYLFTVADQLAGFALLSEPNEHVYELTEFFILRSMRRRGIGRAAANQLFTLFPGAWHIGHDERNVSAQRFWKRTIDSFTLGKFEQSISNDSTMRLEYYFTAKR